MLPLVPYLAHEDHASTWAAQTLVCGGGHDVSVLERAVHHTGRHQAADVCHVNQQVGANLRTPNTLISFTAYLFVDECGTA